MKAREGLLTYLGTCLLGSVLSAGVLSYQLEAADASVLGEELSWLAVLLGTVAGLPLLAVLSAAVLFPLASLYSHLTNWLHDEATPSTTLAAQVGFIGLGYVAVLGSLQLLFDAAPQLIGPALGYPLAAFGVAAWLCGRRLRMLA